VRPAPPSGHRGPPLAGGGSPFGLALAGWSSARPC